MRDRYLARPRAAALQPKLCLGLWLIQAFHSVTAAADEPLPAYLPPDIPQFAPHPALLLIRAIAALALVLGLVAATAWLARQRVGLASGPAAARRLHLIETMPLGAGRSLHLVACGPKVVLLGSGPEGAAYLTELSAAEVGWDPAAAAAPTAPPETFLSRLQNVRLDALGAQRQGA